MEQKQKVKSVYMNSEKSPKIVLIVGKSNSGKTTLMEKLIRELSVRDFRVGSVDHTHDKKVDFDKKGKDTEPLADLVARHFPGALPGRGA